MIVGELKEWKSVAALAQMAPAFEFLESKASLNLPPGKHLIQGDDLFAMVVKVPSRPTESAEFESHRKYIDIQYLASGLERIGVARAEGLAVTRPYDDSGDVVFYSIPKEYEWLEMSPGRFALFYPDDAHLPNCHLNGEHMLHKIVVKVATRFLENGSSGSEAD